MPRLGNYSATIRCAKERQAAVEKGDGVVELFDGTEYQASLTNHSRARAIAELRIDGVMMGSFVLRAGQSWDIERPDSDIARKFRFDAVGGANATRAGAVSGAATNGLVSVTFAPERAVPVPVVHRAYSSWGEPLPSYSPRVEFDDFCGGAMPMAQEAAVCSTMGMAPAAAAPAAALFAASSVPSGLERRAECAARPPATPANTTRREGVTTLGEVSAQSFVEVDAFECDWDAAVEIHLRLAVVARPSRVGPGLPPVFPLSALGRRSTPVPPPIAPGGPSPRLRYGGCSGVHPMIYPFYCDECGYSTGGFDLDEPVPSPPGLPELA